MRAAWWIGALISSLVSLAAVGASAQDDIAAATEAICCGANCCLIGGQCFDRGERNPANECQQCDPTASQGAFSAVSGCTGARDAGSGGGGGGGCSVSAVSVGSAGVLGAFAMAFGLLAWRRRAS